MKLTNFFQSALIEQPVACIHIILYVFPIAAFVLVYTHMWTDAADYIMKQRRLSFPYTSLIRAQLHDFIRSYTVSYACTFVAHFTILSLRVLFYSPMYIFWFHNQTWPAIATLFHSQFRKFWKRLSQTHLEQHLKWTGYFPNCQTLFLSNLVYAKVSIVTQGKIVHRNLVHKIVYTVMYN